MLRASPPSRFQWKSSFGDTKNMIYATKDATKRQRQDNMMWRPRIISALMQYNFRGGSVRRTTLKNNIGYVRSHRYVAWLTNPEARNLIWTQQWEKANGKGFEYKRNPPVKETSVLPFGTTEIDQAVGRVHTLVNKWVIEEQKNATRQQVEEVASSAADLLKDCGDIFSRLEAMERGQLRHAQADPQQADAVHEDLSRFGATASLAMEPRTLLILTEAVANSGLFLPALHPALVVAVTENFYSYDMPSLWRALHNLLECTAAKLVTLGNTGGATSKLILDDIAINSPPLARKMLSEGGMIKLMGSARRRGRHDKMITALYIGFGLSGWSFSQAGRHPTQLLPLKNAAVCWKTHPAAPFAYLTYTLKLDDKLVQEMRRAGWGQGSQHGRNSGRRAGSPPRHTRHGKQILETEQPPSVPEQLLALGRWLEILGDCAGPVQEAAQDALRGRSQLEADGSVMESVEFPLHRLERCQSLCADVLLLAADVVRCAANDGGVALTKNSAATARLLGSLEWHCLHWNPTEKDEQQLEEHAKGTNAPGDALVPIDLKPVDDLLPYTPILTNRKAFTKALTPTFTATVILVAECVGFLSRVAPLVPLDVAIAIHRTLRAATMMVEEVEMKERIGGGVATGSAVEVISTEGVALMHQLEENIAYAA